MKGKETTDDGGCKRLEAGSSKLEAGNVPGEQGG
jgi:hypothetical protein